MPPITLFYNATVLTMDADSTEANAVAIEGERILAVGRYDDLRAKVIGDCIKIDLKGQTLMPAFIDPHGHFPDSGLVREFRVNLAPAPMGECQKLEDVLRLLKEKIDHTPAGEWIMGAAYDESHIAEGRMPSRQELDNLSSLHPIWVIHSSGHCGVANSLALQLQFINENTPDPLGGRYGRDNKTGQLNGYIEGLSAMGEMGDTQFLINRDSFAVAFQSSKDEYLSYGVTLAQNSWTAQPLLELFREVAEQDDTGIDLILLPVSEDEPTLSQNGLATEWPDNDQIQLGPRKLLTDGSFLMRTAYLTESYYSQDQQAEPEYGLKYIEPDKLNVEVKKLHDLGFQVHIHCNGDASTDMFLDAVELALESNPRLDHRHTLIHGQVMREDQMQRCARLGVTISFFSAHIYYWGDRHYSNILGPERAQNISPTGWAEAAGVRFTIHNDASVTPTRPLHLIHTAVNRKTSSGRILGENQKISALKAIQSHTIDAAWQVFQEGERGSIEVGKLADLVVLDGNPLDNPDAIDSLSVQQTYRRGKKVYSKGS